MKKLPATIIGLAIFLTPGSGILAQQEAAFLQAVSNVAQLENFKMIQSFYGRAEIEDVEFNEHLSFAYRLTVNSAIDNDSSPGSFNRISLFLKAYNHNEPDEFELPFKEITVNLSAEVIAKNETDIYFKLSNFSINLEGAKGTAEQDVSDIKQEVLPFMNIWYYEPVTSYTNEENVDLELQGYLEFEDDLAEDPEQAITKLAEQALLDSGFEMTEGDIEEILEGVGLILKTKLFNHLDVVTGNNIGFKFFSLNKSAIVNLAKDFGEQIGEPLTDEDESVLRSGLSKFSLSGIYRITGDLLDNFVLRFKLREVESLKNSEFNYRFKLTDSENQNVIKAPSSYELFDTF